MLHVIAKLATSLGIVIFGLGSGYFGTAAYYERHPQSVAQSGELGKNTDTIGYTHKDILLAITPWENWKAWLNREKAVKANISSDSPKTTEFSTLKTTLTSSGSGDRSVKKACATLYTKKSTDTDSSNITADIKKYCQLTYPSSDD